ncbi:hypothetical protein GWK36_14080 [Caldichromatium japonicum]|uniref:Flagellar hook-length control protein-like C-terminal domain-containing protein n=1 Tax=Caldichromatium japonicum TaxID=2699430 RepID=A0A6G7VFV7_9GAMM|nr:flagellar hook-length control protein FliK [Caldichromatium japonicum]QIK38929.1 hypothetical protein GWK36_14080 [Caldichromatium japonicum]
MTQTFSLSGLSGWLTQILGELDTGAALGTADSADFVGSFAAQICALLLKQGVDPQAVAALDDQTLVGQCLALMADQQPLGLGGLSLTLTDATSVLPEAATDDGQSDPDDTDPQTEDSGVYLGWLPTAVLDRLAQSGAMLLQSATSQSSCPDGQVTTLGGMATGGALLDPIAGRGRFAVRLSQVQAAQMSMPTIDGGSVADAETAAGPERWNGWLGKVLGAETAQINRYQVADLGGQDPRLGPDDALQTALDASTATLRSVVPDPVQGVGVRSATDPAATAGVRTQVLDLNRLLQPGGEQTLAAQVRWSLEQGLDTAEIKLHPPSLGGLEVRVVQDGERTHVHFVTAHPVAREVLDAALPKLRESLAQEGIWLGNVSVSDQAPRRDQGQGRGSPTQTSALDEIDEDESGTLAVQDTLTILARRLDVFS